jgi:hypothetical protein
MARYRLFGTPTLSREIRIYLNLNPERILDVLGALTEELVRWDIPHSLKVSARKALMRRREKIVVYIDERDFEVAIALIGRFQRSRVETFIDDPPLFTCPLLPGLSFAESPASRQSFGMSRAALCAAALAKIRIEARNSFEGRLEAMRTEFARHGISMERPFLSANSTFRYDLSLMRAVSK